MVERKIDNLSYSAVEWRAHTILKLEKDKKLKIIEILNALEDLDDVQKIFTNVLLEN